MKCYFKEIKWLFCYTEVLKVVHLFDLEQYPVIHSFSCIRSLTYRACDPSRRLNMQAMSRREEQTFSTHNSTQVTLYRGSLVVWWSLWVNSSLRTEMNKRIKTCFFYFSHKASPFHYPQFHLHALTGWANALWEAETYDVLFSVFSKQVWLVTT